MTKVKIDPGVCGLVTTVEACANDEQEVTLQVKSACAAVRNMFETLGTTFDSYELCLGKPGTGTLYEYAAENFPGHCACPTIAGILKAAEVESHLALPKAVSITFESNV